MFIYIGDDNVLQVKDIVAIIDHSVVTSSIITQETIAQTKANGDLYGDPDQAKTVIITTERIYYSSLSAATLKKRSGMVSVISKLEDYSDHIEID
ncbi:extracellular matrix regulator RemB [Lentibacillus saliphilus]|uniref:extracellular matrix regulator RemB n=1 Tax=Lentibacillus saliphilus TaxID=2737028 RepID=UPI001C305986|nr:extracellular matrix/biofilm biosynthesis regulator RemA family protein [Lentibacillus saliphilus]